MGRPVAFGDVGRESDPQFLVRARSIPAHTATGKVLGLGMAVRAQQSNVLETIVLPYAIAMMERHAQRPSHPFRQAALFTAILLQSRIEQASFQVASVCLLSALYQEEFDWHRLGTGLHGSALNGS